MSTTFTELVQLSSTLSGAGSVSLAAGLHAQLTGRGTVGADGGGLTMGFVSGGVTYSTLRSSLDGVGTITAPLSVYRSLQATLSGVGAIRQGDGGSAAFAALESLSGDTPYAGAVGDMPSLSGYSSDPLPVPNYTSAIGVLPALVSTATSLTGGVGTSDVSLAALVGVSSDFPYAAGASSLPSLESRANDEQTAFGLAAKNYIYSIVTMDAQAEYFINLSESAELTATISVLRELIGDMAEEMNATSAYDVAAEYSASMSETMQFLAGLEQQGQQLVWVTNSDTGANAMYRGWEFTSFGSWMGRYFGTSPQGLYELVGDTDDGTPIVSSVLTGKSDLGTVQQKRVAHVYVGGTAAGELTLTVHTDDGATNDYVISARELLGNTRTAIGKGLRSKYWQFEVTNRDGGDFALESLELLPDITTRRI